MKLEKVNDGTNTYLIYKLDEANDVVDEVAERMINNNQNKMKGIAPILFNRMNGRYDTMRFDITGKISLAECTAHRINQKNFRNIMLKLTESFELLDDYMIDLSQIYLDKNYVFINEINCEISFICIAIENKKIENGQQKFFLDLIMNMSVDISDTEEDYFHRVWNVVNSKSFSVKNIQYALMSVKTDNQTDKKEIVNVEKIEPVYKEPVKTIKEKIDIPEPEIINIALEQNKNTEKKSGIFNKLKKIIKGNETEKKNEYSGGISELKDTAPKKNDYSGGLLALKDNTSKKSGYSGGLSKLKDNFSKNKTDIAKSAIPESSIPYQSESGFTDSMETTLLEDNTYINNTEMVRGNVMETTLLEDTAHIDKMQTVSYNTKNNDVYSYNMKSLNSPKVTASVNNIKDYEKSEILVNKENNQTSEKKLKKTTEF